MDDPDLRAPIIEPTWQFFLFATVVAPLLENGMLVGLLAALGSMLRNDIAIVLAAACMAGLHTVDNWQHAVVVFPGFVIYAITYRAHASRQFKGYLASCAVHGCQNALVCGAALVASS